MSLFIFISCAIVNKSLFVTYNLEEEECSWKVRRSVLAGYSWEYFIHQIKVRLLSKSIHKGKFLGFMVDGVVKHRFDLSNPTVSHEITVVIENVDATDDTLAEVVQLRLSEFKNLVKEAALDKRTAFRKRLAVELAYTSDKIEGTTIEAEEAKANLEHFRDELPLSLQDADHIEMRNHMFAVEDHVYRMHDKPITSINVEYLLELHRVLDISHMVEENKGDFRKIEVTIANGPNPGFTRAANVPCAVDAMLLELHNADKNTDTLELAAWLHFAFVQIHPFADGNGRVGRLLMNTLLLQRGFPLICIHPNTRDLYFKSLQVARRIKNGALAQPDGTSTPYAFLKRILSECTVRSLETGISMLSAPL